MSQWAGVVASIANNSAWNSTASRCARAVAVGETFEYQGRTIDRTIAGFRFEIVGVADGRKRSRWARHAQEDRRRVAAWPGRRRLPGRHRRLTAPRLRVQLP
jgi:hypothetical protein